WIMRASVRIVHLDDNVANSMATTPMRRRTAVWMCSLQDIRQVEQLQIQRLHPSDDFLQPRQRGGAVEVSNEVSELPAFEGGDGFSAQPRGEEPVERRGSASPLYVAQDRCPDLELDIVLFLEVLRQCGRIGARALGDDRQGMLLAA